MPVLIIQEGSLRRFRRFIQRAVHQESIATVIQTFDLSESVSCSRMCESGEEVEYQLVCRRRGEELRENTGRQARARWWIQ